MSDSNSKFSVLFVCMGNICRSPAAEGVFKHYVRDKGRHEQIVIDSAGTIGYHSGSPPDLRMSEAASRRGYKLDSIARQVKQKDIEEFDLIIAMDHDNMRDLTTIARSPREHIRLLGSFLEDDGSIPVIREVPDPYYGGIGGFEKVLDMIEAACPDILQHCLSNISNH